MPAQSPGSYVAIEGGYSAFVPLPLPRDLRVTSALNSQLDRATQAAARLSGVGEIIPAPDLLIRPFVNREAVLSSMIEGTQTLMADLILFEVTDEKQDPRGDAREVRNYVRSLEHGLARLRELPLSVRLFNELHAILMTGARGADKRPGELRDRQVYVGDRGGGVAMAQFIPPPAAHVRDLLLALERFLNEPNELPTLVECALMHYQFETIHPYLDGNGRLGRLLIVLLLCERELMTKPLLYLSAYLETNRDAYYAHLNRVRDTGEWEPYLLFFLKGVEEQANDALERSRRVLALHESYKTRLREARGSANAHSLLDATFRYPLLNVRFASRLLNVTPAGARGVLRRLVDAGILAEQRGSWPMRYSAEELLRVIEEPITREEEP